METTAIVLKVTCGTTLKTVVQGVPIEIECSTGGPPPGTITVPEGPRGEGGVVAYLREVELASRLDLDQLAVAVERGLDAGDLPQTVDAQHDWAVYLDEDGRSGSLGNMMIDPR